MTSQPGPPSREVFFRNLRQPMPIGRKLRRLLVNRARALRRGCCDHPGEPGC